MTDHCTLIIEKLGRSLVARRSAWLEADRSPASPFFHNHLKGFAHREGLACMLRARDVADSLQSARRGGPVSKLGVGSVRPNTMGLV
jgi:hypothetical protein